MILAILGAVVFLAAGFSFGWLVAALRTDRLIAKMSPDELRSLAARVKLRKR